MAAIIPTINEYDIGKTVKLILQMRVINSDF